MIFISILILIVAIALPSFNKNISSLMITRISSIIFIYSGVLSYNALYIQSIGSGIGIYSGLFHITIVSQLLDSMLLILAGLILVTWPIITSTYINKLYNITKLIKDQSKKNLIGVYTPKTEYSLIILFSALGSSLLISSSDLLSLYLSIELQSFGLYILTTLYRDYESATASGLKYFLLGALSSCFILLGIGLIYTFTGITNFEGIFSLISVTYNYNLLNGVSLGVILIFIGFLFKVSAAPFHSWSPDVYDETPTQVTTWLTIIPKISILGLLLELQSGFTYEIDPNITVTSYNISYILKMLLLITALISLIVGTIVGLAQTRIKRLLAYSTISHIGFILLALAINTEQSIDSFIFYILQYSLTNLNIFLIILGLGYIIHKNGIKLYSNSNNIYLFDFDIRYIITLKGQFFANPLLSLALSISLFSMAGIPPLLGFFSKQFVLYSAIQNGYYFMSFIAIIVSIISASYYLRIILLLFSDQDPISNNNNKIINNNNNNELLLSNVHSFIIATLTLSILLFIFKPTLILNSTQLLALSLFNY